MGSVHGYQSARGKRYLVRYKKPDGSQGAKRGFRTKREAESFLFEVESARRQGSFLDPQAAKTRVDQLGQVWLDAKRSSMKPSSFAPVETAWRLRVQPKWGRWPVSDIVFTEVRAWVAELNRSSGATVVIRTYGVLAGILDDAVRDGRISRNPARAGDVGLPRKVRGRHSYLSHQEVLRLAEAAGERRALILVLAYTGIRWGEAAGLRVEDVEFAKGRLNITQNAVEVHGTVHLGTPKSTRGRLVPVPNFVLDVLREHTIGRAAGDLVFPAADGTYMRRVRASSNSKSWFKTALRDAGLEPMTLHDLRHTAASLAVQSGAHVKTIQRMLGHTSASMTLDVYADLFDTDLDHVSHALDTAANEAAGEAIRKLRGSGPNTT